MISHVLKYLLAICWHPSWAGQTIKSQLAERDVRQAVDCAPTLEHNRVWRTQEHNVCTAGCRTEEPELSAYGILCIALNVEHELATRRHRGHLGGRDRSRHSERPEFLLVPYEVQSERVEHA
ncbi:MAG: hypothetical protein ACJ786_10590, partial [Catenulispora sp.]